MQESELPGGWGGTAPAGQTRPGQQEPRGVDQLKDPRTQQPGRHEEEHGCTKPCPAMTKDEKQ
mgnify:CR=1 FL=1